MFISGYANTENVFYCLSVLFNTHTCTFFVKCRSNKVVIITIIDAKELGLLLDTSNKMINIEYNGCTMQALPSCKWCKVQAPSCMNEFGLNVINTGALVRQRLSPRECTFLLVSLVQMD